MLTPPFTREGYIQAVGPTFALAANVTKQRPKARASSILSCARSIAYMMAGVEDEPLGEPHSRRTDDLELTAEQGRHMEDLSVAVIRTMGFEVIDRQVCIGHERCDDKHRQGPVDYPVTGHPDGRIIRVEDGLVWGFEHKHLGRYQFEKILQQGVMAAKPEYIAQAVLYGKALGWDAVQFVVQAQDSSSVRGDMTANLRAKNPAMRWAVKDVHPKLWVGAVDLRPLYETMFPALELRANWFRKYQPEFAANPELVVREFSPFDMKDHWISVDGVATTMEVPDDFECAYCPHLTRCRTSEVEGTLSAPNWGGSGGN